MRLITCVLVIAIGCGKSDAPKPKADDPWAATPSASANPAPADPPRTSVEGAFIGRWGTSHANWDMTSSGIHGAEKHVYVFASDGRYAFHREATLAEGTKYYLVDESGTISVDGTTLTLAPATVTASVRDPDGKVLETPDLPRERTSYAWQLHLFTGIQETDLVLVPTDGTETGRDGPFASNDQFPKSYLLAPDPRFEWKFPN